MKQNAISHFYYHAMTNTKQKKTKNRKFQNSTKFQNQPIQSMQQHKY